MLPNLFAKEIWSWLIDKSFHFSLHNQQQLQITSSQPAQTCPRALHATSKVGLDESHSVISQMRWLNKLQPPPSSWPDVLMWSEINLLNTWGYERQGLSGARTICPAGEQELRASPSTSGWIREAQEVPPLFKALGLSA